MLVCDVCGAEMTCLSAARERQCNGAEHHPTSGTCDGYWRLAATAVATTAVATARCYRQCRLRPATFCSLPKGHTGDHKAHRMNVLSGALLHQWDNPSPNVYGPPPSTPLLPEMRYKTVKERLPEVATPEPTWREWRDHNRPASECPCGIARAMCSYHRE